MGILSLIKRNSFSALAYKAFCKPACCLAYVLSRLLPVRDAAVFVSTPDYADNARVLCDYFRKDKRFKDLRIVWLVGDDEAAAAVQADGLKFLRLRYGVKGFKASFLAGRARYVFFTHGFFPSYYRIREGQVVANLWHGCGYKYVPPSSMPFTFALVPGDLFVDIKAKSFSCDKKKIIPIGYPRYDRMINPPTDTGEVLRRLKLPESEKIILWLPTFRNSIRKDYEEGKIESELGLPLLRNVEELLELDRECTKLGLCLLVKRHPSQAAYEIERLSSSLTSIKFITQRNLVLSHIDLYELFAASDALISDYSSAAVDYLLLDKPLGFVLDDFDEYEAARGFCLTNVKSYMPGAHIYSYADLTIFLECVASNDDQFADARRRMLRLAHNSCNCYSERVLGLLDTIAVDESGDDSINE